MPHSRYGRGWKGGSRKYFGQNEGRRLKRFSLSPKIRKMRVCSNKNNGYFDHNPISWSIQGIVNAQLVAPEKKKKKAQNIEQPDYTRWSLKKNTSDASLIREKVLSLPTSQTHTHTHTYSCRNFPPEIFLYWCISEYLPRFPLQNRKASCQKKPT